MYQLGMPAFTDNVEWYCRDLSDASPTLTPNTPTASSPLSDKELQAIEWSEAHWTGNFRWTPLSLDHPHYDKACFHCHRLGHIRINCQFYTCPICLCNALDHVQNCCPLCCWFNSTCTTSSSSSSFNHSNSSAGFICLMPSPLKDRLSSPPPRCTFQGSHYTTTARIHAPFIWFWSVRSLTPGTDDNNVYDTDTWRNINGDWGVSAVLQHYNGGNIMIAHYFLHFIHLCLSLVPWSVDCLSPIDCVSFISFYLHNFRFTHSLLEYSLQNIPLYYWLLYCVLPPFLFLVILLTVDVYKPHSSLLLFPMLVYLVLLASIYLLVALLGLW